MKSYKAVGLALAMTVTVLRAQEEIPVVRPVEQQPPPATAQTDPAEEKPKKFDPEKDQVFTNSIKMVVIQVGGFWAGKYEVTQAEYQAVMGGNPSAFAGELYPVDSVSWNDALAFCRKLTAMEREKDIIPEGYGYTLPTESQWESLVGGATLEQAVTSEKGSRSSSAPVGTKAPNSIGLYDVRGNLLEHCLDRADPSQSYRVVRGAAWDSNFEVNLRTNFRHYANGADDRKNTYGFRCILVRGVQASETAGKGASTGY